MTFWGGRVSESHRPRSGAAEATAAFETFGSTRTYDVHDSVILTFRIPKTFRTAEIGAKASNKTCNKTRGHPVRGGRAHLVDTLVDTTRDTTEVQFDGVSFTLFSSQLSPTHSSPAIPRYQ